MVAKMKGKATTENLRESQMMTDLITMLSDAGIVDNANAAKAIIVGLGAAGVGAGAALTTAVQAMVKKMTGKATTENLRESQMMTDLITMLSDSGIVDNANAAKAIIIGLGAAGVGAGAALTTAVQAMVKKMKGSKSMSEADDEKDMKETSYMQHNAELEEALNVINTLKSELNEINLLNSKLLYTNKIFKAKNLSEAQKIQTLTAFDKAETVKETRLVYETLNSNLNKSDKRELVKENRSFASKTISGTSNKQPVVETSAMVERFQKLAGLK
jgi:hypothetical protein